jgi:hypothetical protein
MGVGMKNSYPVPEVLKPRAGFRSVIFAKDQPEYLQLPALTNGHQVETQWKFSWRDRLRILWSGRVWLTFLTFGKPLQPSRLAAFRDPPDEDPEIDEAESPHDAVEIRPDVERLA